MPLTISPQTASDWNSNRLSIVDGVSRILVSVHGEYDDVVSGTTVSIDRTEFLNMCKAYINVVPPEDTPRPPSMTR